MNPPTVDYWVCVATPRAGWGVLFRTSDREKADACADTVLARWLAAPVNCEGYAVAIFRRAALWQAQT